MKRKREPVGEEEGEEDSAEPEVPVDLSDLPELPMDWQQARWLGVRDMFVHALQLNSAQLRLV